VRLSKNVAADPGGGGVLRQLQIRGLLHRPFGAGLTFCVSQKTFEKAFRKTIVADYGCTSLDLTDVYSNNL